MKVGGMEEGGGDRIVSGLRKRGGDFKALNAPEGGHE